jgi:hypothetical protein
MEEKKIKRCEDFDRCENASIECSYCARNWDNRDIQDNFSEKGDSE